MNFECPTCKKAGQVGDSNIPETGVYATCTQCRTKFLVKHKPTQDFEFEPVRHDKQQTPPSTWQHQSKSDTTKYNSNNNATTTDSNYEKPILNTFLKLSLFTYIFYLIRKGFFNSPPLTNEIFTPFVLICSTILYMLICYIIFIIMVLMYYFIRRNPINFRKVLSTAAITTIITNAIVIIVCFYGYFNPELLDNFKPNSNTRTYQPQGDQPIKPFQTSSPMPASPNLVPMDVPSGTSHKGQVLETMDAAGYTYINVYENGKTFWVAVMQTKVPVGAMIEFPDSEPMLNFQSKSLKRTFDKIIFAPGIRLSNAR